VVVVHDAARPCASPALFAAAIAAVARGADAAVPGLALADTVKRVGDDGVVAATLERAGLIAVQTPQAFTADALRGAHGAAGEATDDAALVEAAGGRVVVVGEVANVKVTVPSDLTAAAGHLAGGAARRRGSGVAAVSAQKPTPTGRPDTEKDGCGGWCSSVVEVGWRGDAGLLGGGT